MSVILYNNINNNIINSFESFVVTNPVLKLCRFFNVNPYGVNWHLPKYKWFIQFKFNYWSEIFS